MSGGGGSAGRGRRCCAEPLPAGLGTPPGPLGSSGDLAGQGLHPDSTGVGIAPPESTGEEAVTTGTLQARLGLH